MKLSPGVIKLMTELAEKYVEAGFPNHRTWLFGSGPTLMVYKELTAARLIEMKGLTGFGFILTDEGRDWIMNNRPDLD